MMLSIQIGNVQVLVTISNRFLCQQTYAYTYLNSTILSFSAIINQQLGWELGTSKVFRNFKYRPNQRHYQHRQQASQLPHGGRSSVTVRCCGAITKCNIVRLTCCACGSPAAERLRQKVHASNVPLSQASSSQWYLLLYVLHTYVWTKKKL